MINKFNVIDLEAVNPAPDPVLPAAGLIRSAAESRLTDAKTDGDLAREFLYGSGLAPKSIENYKKEVYRFLLYCRANELTLSSLKVMHVKAFSKFLINPQPAADWISTTKHARMTVDPVTGAVHSNPRWRPFSGPLSEASRQQAMLVVKAFMQYAQDTGYIPRNPAALVKNAARRQPARIERYLPVQAIELAFAALEALPMVKPADARRRARDTFLLTAWWATGCRLAEIVNATMGSVYREADGRQWLDVTGKGAKQRRVPLPPAFMAAYQRYRTAYGMPPETDKGDSTPLVLSTRLKDIRGVSDEAAAGAMKAIFRLAAQLADARGDVATAAQLRAATTHWLRHSMLSHHANAQVQLKTLQITAGHSNIAITSRYLHREDNERHDELMASFARKADTQG